LLTPQAMQSFEHEGQSIKYVRSGAGAPIVFLHNGGTSHAIWRDVMAELSGFELFALDLPGFGASSRPERAYGIEAHVAALAAFVSHHRLAPVGLVGNCMGSAISLAFAMRYPREVHALVLINPLTEATFAAGRFGATLAVQRRLPSWARAVPRVALGPSIGPSIGAWALRLQVGSRGAERRVHLREDLCACWGGEGQLRSLFAVVADLPNYAALDRLTPAEDFPPICTIWGVDNHVLSSDAGRRLNRTLRPSREEWLEGCGHLAMAERPDRVARVVRETCGARTTEARVSS
jgi:pimeloyl-ACP methyl ester carboxylesterase